MRQQAGLPYLGLWANAIVGEGILPLGQAQVGEEQAIVGSKGICEKMPVQRSVQEPDLGVFR